MTRLESSALGNVRPTRDDGTPVISAARVEASVFWRRIAILAILIAIVSSATAIYTTMRIERVLAQTAEQQLRLLSDRMNDAISEARERADAGDAKLDTRINVITTKFATLPGQVDASVEAMKKTMTETMAAMKKQIPPAVPTPTVSHDESPTVKKRKPS